MAKEHVAGSLAVNVLANTKNFDKKMRASGKRVKNFSEVTSMHMDKVAKSVSSFTGLSVYAMTGLTAGFAALGAAAAAATVTVFRLYDGLATKRDLLTKTAQSLGLTNQQMERWTLATGFAGMSQEKFAQGTKAFTQRMFEAANGTGEAARALNTLGLDAKKLQFGADADTRLRVVLDSLNGIADASTRLAIAQRIFGEEAGLGFARLGTKELTRADRLMAQFGFTSDDSFSKAEEFRDSMLELSTAATLLSNRMLDLFSDELISGLQKAMKLLGQVATVMDRLSVVASKVSDIAGGTSIFTSGANYATMGVTAPGNALLSASGPAGDVINSMNNATADAITTALTFGANNVARDAARTVMGQPVTVVQGGNR